MSKDRFDKHGNMIGDGSYHCEYSVFDIDGVGVNVSFSESSESVYVTYSYGDKRCIVRFSNHLCNSVSFGDYLDGNMAYMNEIRYRLGLCGREFVPDTRLWIESRNVKKIEACNYDECDKTIQELYAMGSGASLSEYVGKLAKGSRLLIIGDVVTEDVIKRRNVMGQDVIIGKFRYFEF